MEAAVGGGIKAGITWPPITRSAALGRSSTNAATTTATANQKSLSSSSSNSNSGFSFTHPLRSLWRKGHNDGVALDDVNFVNVNDQEVEESEKNGGSWVLKILDVQSLWKDHGKNGVLFDEKERKEEEKEVQLEVREGGNVEESGEESCSCCDDDGGCSVEEEEEEEEEENVEFDRDSFSRLLKRVSLTEAKLYARMSYLGSLAYAIPTIKPASLLKHHGLQFVTSSLEKKAHSTNTEEEKVAQGEDTENKPEAEEQKTSRARISASTAFHVAASAASYLQSHTRGILSFKISKAETGDSSHDRSDDSVDKEGRINGNADVKSSELASFVVTTGSVTAVVAAKEETKQAVAKKLSSGSPSPCQWFICDDDQRRTRIFVIQGSESLASWQANLLFEPIQFEGLDVLVHRGIYEAAKGIYEQMLPEVQAHLKSHGNSATFRFTGHSLGGSLSLLVNLMLLIRGEVPISSLLPVIMFGAPSVMCGGDQLLRKLGLPQNHVQAITMHRDIVPRAFSCNYPDHVAELLKAVNGNFRNHPCLKTQKVLYAPMGNILILQPEEKFSPPHDLLPSGSGLYLLTSPLSDSVDPEKQLKAAKAVFFNTPHPLEILSDRSAYGTDGAIYRDHDMHSYLKSVLGVIRLELNQIRKTKREHRRKVWWPSIAPRPRRVHGGGVVGQPAPSHNVTQSQLTFSGIFHNGRESVKRFSRLVASQHMHLLVVFLLPARLLVFGTFAITRFR